MGTVLSLSPRARKDAACRPEHPAADEEEKEQEEAQEEEEEEEEVRRRRRKKRHPLLLQALRWKKQLAAAAAAARGKRRSGKKVKPAEPQGGREREDLRDQDRDRDRDPWPPREQQPPPAAADGRQRALKVAHRHAPIPVPVPTVPGPGADGGQQGALLSPRRVLVQASTGELLRCLSAFVCRRCVKLKSLSSTQIIIWFRNVDRALLLQGWQEKCFISPAGLVFVYLLCREAVAEDTSSEQELRCTFLTCLYLAYSYLGHEISYPLKPFLAEGSRDAFWRRALALIGRLSADMLRLNAEPRFFTQVFRDLKSQGRSGDAQGPQGRPGPPSPPGDAQGPEEPDR